MPTETMRSHFARVVELEVVHDADVHRELARLRLLADVLRLVVAERDAEALDAVFLGGVEHEMAPAAADVEQALAGSEIELANVCAIF